MSDLFTSLKNNIIPLQKAIQRHTNSFIESLLESEYYSYDNEYSEDFESDSEQENNLESETVTENKVKTPESKVDLNEELQVPKQQTFDEPEKKDSENEEFIIEKTNLDSVILTNNLTVLANLQVNQKLYISNITTNSKLNFEILLDNSYFPQVSRWYYSQNRINTINTIENLIDLTIEEINYYNYTKNQELTEKFTNLLKNVAVGLNKLKTTYESDGDNSYKITKIINKINEHL